MRSAADRRREAMGSRFIDNAEDRQIFSSSRYLRDKLFVRNKEF
jgi:hypothetical protein